MPAPNKLTIDLAETNCERLLADWRWLVPVDYVPIEITLFGDWLLESPDGAIHFLDLVGGTLTQIASDRIEFDGLKQEPENCDQWYIYELALLCHNAGIRPKRNQCLGYRLPPVVGGELTVDNIEVTDLAVHQCLLGQIHRQTQDLPEGTIINKFTVDGEDL